MNEERPQRLSMLLVALLSGLAITQSFGLTDSPRFSLLGWGGMVLGLTALGMAGWGLARIHAEPGARLAVRAGVTVVLVHLLVVLAHAVAHDALGVELSALQMVYAWAVILLAPLGAAALLLSARRAFAGAVVLAASMAGALVFGLFSHYMAVSPDHVSHLPPGPGQGSFRATAALLVIIEALGVAAGLWCARRLRRAGSETRPRPPRVPAPP